MCCYVCAVYCCWQPKYQNQILNIVTLLRYPHVCVSKYLSTLVIHWPAVLPAPQDADIKFKSTTILRKRLKTIPLCILNGYSLLCFSFFVLIKPVGSVLTSLAFGWGSIHFESLPGHLRIYSGILVLSSDLTEDIFGSSMHMNTTLSCCTLSCVLCIIV